MTSLAIELVACPLTNETFQRVPGLSKVRDKLSYKSLILQFSTEIVMNINLKCIITNT